MSTNKRVNITESNFRHCRCPQCPVQAKSDCASRADGNLYCARGKAPCDDLDKNESCICSSCLVWDENNLGSMYYCIRGSAEDNG